MRHLLILVIISFFTNCIPDSSTSRTQDYDRLVSNFPDPPKQARPKALWTWLNGNFDLETLSKEMAEANEKGLGGFDIWDVGMLVDEDSIVPKGPAFMSDESIEAIVHALKEAEKYDMEMGLTISSSWNAGGSWVKEEHGVMGLFRSSVQVVGGGSVKIRIPTPGLEHSMNMDMYGEQERLLDIDEQNLPSFYKDVALVAFPISKDSIVTKEEIINLTDLLEGDSIFWDFPDGQWQITRYTCMPTGQSLMVPSANSNGLMIDHFSAEAMTMHLNYFFEKLKPQIEDLGKSSLKYLYTDSYEANSAAWTPKLPQEFQKLRGYDIRKYLPVLDGFTIDDKPTSERFAYDYRKTLSDLIISNHYALGKQMCNDEGIGFVAEAGGPGPPVHNVPFQDLAALGALTVPRGEFWHDHPQGKSHMDELQIVKGISSAAHIYDQTFVEAEAFTSIWLWQEGPMNLKPVADKAFCEGLNRIVYHTFPHIPPEAGHPGWIYNFGTVMNTHRAWWPKSRQWNDYLARVSYMMQQGNFVADVAYYYGNEAPNFVGHKQIYPWLGNGYDYDAINTEILASAMEVKDGRLVLPHGQSYSVLVLPEESRMELDVIKKIKALVKEGATVIGPKPSKVYGLKDYKDKEGELEQIASELWGDCDGEKVKEHQYGKGKIIWGKTAREVLTEMDIIPDFQYNSSNKEHLEYVHRELGDLDIYFVRNADSTSIHTDITFRTVGTPELWDPDNGSIAKYPVYQKNVNSTLLPIDLGPYDSYVIVFRKGLDGDHISKISKKGETLFPGGHGFELIFKKDGQLVLAFDEPYQYDITYTSGIIEEFQASEYQIQPIESPWKIEFNPNWDAPPNTTFDTLVPWNLHTDPGIQTYSGTAKYSTVFQAKENEQPDIQWYVDLGDVYEVADFKINGSYLGIRSFFPFEYNVTTQLEENNKLEIEVVNLLNNQLVGEGRKPPEFRKTKSNIKKLPSAWAQPMGKAPLLKSGLIGPARLIGKHVYQPKI